MVPLHLAYIFQPNGEISWVSRIPPAGSNDWGVRTFGTPMEVAMPLTGAEVRRFKAWCKRQGHRFNLTLDNEEWAYKTVLDLAHNYRGKPAGLANAIREFVMIDTEFGFSPMLRAVRGDDKLARVILTTFLDDVDWEEIAKAKLSGD